MSILELTATFGQSANGERFFIFAALPGSTKISAQLVPAVWLLGNEI